MDTHFLDIKEKIELPSERCIHAVPSTATVAALDAILAVTHKSLRADVPSKSALIEMSEENNPHPWHITAAHQVLDTIEELRIDIFIFKERIEEHLKQCKNQELPF